MTTRVKITTKGFEEYLERIAQAGLNVDAAAAKALRAGAQVALDGMKQRVPKDTHNLEEHLEASEPQQDGNFTFVTVGMRPGADAETARYGNAQEYGSSSMPAHPYIRPTMDADASKIKAAMRESLKSEGVVE